MKGLSVFAFAMLLTGMATFAQDTTSVVMKQGDPVPLSPEKTQEVMLKDMVRIGSEQVPESVRRAISDAAFRGDKTFYKHKEKDEYAVEIKEGEVTKFHFFDKDGRPLSNQR